MNFASFRTGLTRAAVVAVGLTLAGCASGGLLDDMDQAQPTGGPFSQALYKDYSYLAHSFGDAGSSGSTAFDSGSSMSLDGSNSDVADLVTAYAQKAIDAAAGNEVLPEPPPDGNADAATMRDRVLKDLGDGRDKFPNESARVQVSYDCWIMNARVDGLRSASAQCRRQLDAAIGDLEHKLNPVTVTTTTTTTTASADYQVYFNFNSWTLKAEELQVLQQAIATARAGGQSRITIVGHTDTSGSTGYNQRLSEKRANVVTEALVDMGARREAIQASGVGESDLAVQTGDGVKEPKNRRAVITLFP